MVIFGALGAAHEGMSRVSAVGDSVPGRATHTVWLPGVIDAAPAPGPTTTE